MLLTISTSHSPARDLGFLLYKHPDRCQTFEESFGDVHVFYPEATDKRCTAAMLLDVDPVGLVRGQGETLSQYVNDRPYVASSFMSVAIAQVLGTALSGRSKERPELAETAILLEASLTVVSSGRAGDELLHRLFQPLGYEVDAEVHPLDKAYPEWGAGTYATLTLRGRVRVRDLLAHLYVLIPVLDNSKHYYVGSEEVDKLFRYGEGWLEDHPERTLITRRYLQYGDVIREGLNRLEDSEASVEGTASDASRRDRSEMAVEQPMRLNEQRMGAVAAVIKASGARRVLDLGCGEGKLIKQMLNDDQLEKIVGLDVSVRALERASERLALDRKPPALRDKVDLLHGSLTYKDDRIKGFDAAALVEVVEHLDPNRLSALEHVVFAHARPGTVVITTPNREYNALFNSLPAGAMRHRDHRFEWTRAEFQAWAERSGDEHGYEVEFLPIGPENPDHGAPTQMGVFRRT